MKSIALAAAFLFFAPSLVQADRSQFTTAGSVEDVDARLAKIPEDRGSRRKAYLLSDKATFLYKGGQMVEAAAIFEEALTYRAPRKVRRHIYLYLGKAYESHGRLDKAIAAYEEALAFDPKNWRRHRDLAGLYEQVKLYPKARGYYMSARKMAPREASLWYVSGRVYRKMGLFLEAEPFLAQAETLGFDDNVLRRERSLIWEGRGRFREALDVWVQATADASLPEDLGRTVYLAVLAGNEGVARDNVKRLRAAGVSKETLQLYENLVQLPPSGPELDALVTSFLSRLSDEGDRTP